jgi:hypothetical protein
MNLLHRIAHTLDPGPDPTAVAHGLTVHRVGWGRYTYSGLPAHLRGRPRRAYDPGDPLDRLLCPELAPPAGVPVPTR